MMLSDRDIGERMWGKRHTDATRIVIDPKPNIACLQPASVDLTLLPEIKVEWGDEEIYRDLIWQPLDITTYADFGPGERKGYPLLPGQVVLASTAETIHVPVDLSARVEGKSTLGRLFITTHKTAGFIDPGFRGKITLEIKNEGPVVQYLQAGMRIGQICFTQLTSPALRPYGAEGLGSHYQNQDRATPAAA